MFIYPIIILVVLNQIDCTTKVVETPLEALFNDVRFKSEIDDLFKKFLEELKEILINGSKFFGIPPLDPFKSGPINGSINLEDMKGDMSADSIEISDLSNYGVTEAEINGLISKMGLQWNKIEGNISSYDIKNGRFMNFVNVFGNGDAIFTLDNLKFSTQVTMELKNEKLFIKSMESKVSLGGLKFYTEGLYNNSLISEDMSAAISEIGPEFLKTYEKNLTDKINKRIMDIANEYLSDTALNDLINIVDGKFS